MTKEAYLQLIEKELHAIVEVIKRKNHDYTGGSEDPFANFKVCESLELCQAETGILIRMVDKIQRVKSFLKKGELKVQNESATDAARDIIGYSLILIGMMSDKGNK